MADTFQVWLGEQDDDIRELVAVEQLKGASVSQILKMLIRRGADKRDERIIKMLERIEHMLKEKSNE